MRHCLTTTTTFLALALISVASPSPSQDQPLMVRVGMIDSLFDEKDEKVIFARMQPFADVVKRRDGVNSEFVPVKGVDAMCQGLLANKLGLGVLHGVEYSWLRRSCPDARAILVAVINETSVLKAHVLVARDNPVKNLTDMKDQTLALPRRVPMHCRLFLERRIQKEPEQFLKMIEFRNADDAIEAVITGKAIVTVASNIALTNYRQQKPGRFNRLRVLEESPNFPAPVLVYRPNTVSDDTVRKFRESLMTANQTPEGRQTLTLWRFDGFQPVPDDFEKLVEDIGKIYPPPAK